MAEFGDILEYDRIDSYETLPDKTFAGYQGCSKNNPDRARKSSWKIVHDFYFSTISNLNKYLARNCPNKEYGIFIDDDVFVRTEDMKNQMKKISPGETCDILHCDTLEYDIGAFYVSICTKQCYLCTNGISRTEFSMNNCTYFCAVHPVTGYFCSVTCSEHDAIRCPMANGCIYQEDRANYFGKYFLWVDTWPQKYFIPPYSAGCATAMTASAAKKIYEERNTRIQRTKHWMSGYRPYPVRVSLY